MILLSNNTPIAVTITGIVLILGLFGFGLYKVFIVDKSKAKKLLEDFLNGLADEIYKIIVQTINDFKIEEFDFESLEEYEAKVLEQLYKTIYEYTLKKANEAASDENSPITFKMFDLIEKEDIDKIIEHVYNNGNVKILIKDAWAKYFESKVDAMEEEVQDVAIGHDIDGNEIIYSGDGYNEDFVDELPAAEEDIINEDLYRAVIPPSENESINDDLVMDGEPEKPYIKTEIESEEDLPISYIDTDIPMETTDLPYFIDKNGRKRDKITGRFVR